MRVDALHFLIDESRASWLLRLYYRMVRKMMGKLTGLETLGDPVQLAAHSTRVLLGTTGMEMAQGGFASVPHNLVALASLTASRMVGCPF